MQETMTGARRRGGPRRARMNDIKTMEESIRMAEAEINGESTSMVWPTLGLRTAEKQNRTDSLQQQPH